MRVLVDLDGVMADFCLAFTNLAANTGLVDAPWSTSQQPTWRFDFHVDPVWRVANDRLNWWMSLEPLVTPTEVEALNKASLSHSIWYVTNRSYGRGLPVETQSIEWLKSIGIKFPLVAVSINKAETAQRLDLSVALEDKPDSLESLRNAGILAVARRWEYNKDWEPSVGSVGEFIERYI